MRQPHYPEVANAPFSVRLSDGTLRRYTPWGTNPYPPRPQTNPDAPRRRKPLKRSPPGLEGQLIVGRRVGTEPEPRWKPEPILEFATRIRTEQVQESVRRHGLKSAQVGGAVASQTGFWGYTTDMSATTGTEPSVEISIQKRETGETDEEFSDNIIELGYRLAEKFLQDAVIGRIVERGLVRDGFTCETEAA